MTIMGALPWVVSVDAPGNRPEALCSTCFRDRTLGPRKQGRGGWPTRATWGRFICATKVRMAQPLHGAQGGQRLLDTAGPRDAPREHDAPPHRRRRRLPGRLVENRCREVIGADREPLDEEVPKRSPPPCTTAMPAKEEPNRRVTAQDAEVVGADGACTAPTQLRTPLARRSAAGQMGPCAVRDPGPGRRFDRMLPPFYSRMHTEAVSALLRPQHRGRQEEGA